MPTLVCVPILVQEEHLAAADAVAARDAGADVVEFRVDEFFTGVKNAAGDLEAREVEGILRLVAGCPLPCIVTCRAASEGGSYDGDEMARVALYERLGTANGGAGKGEHPPRYLDIELAAYRSSANLRQKVHLAVDWPEERREGRPGLILSTHDFQGRPADLMRRVSAMRDEDAARVAKVAYTARSLRDNLELFDLLRENAGGKPTIALGMGRFGLMSRVLAPKFGGYLTFASLRAQSATAPGQPTVRELLDLYRFRSIGARTKVYGVIGWPVEHSLSPLVHNAGFEAVGHDGVYLPLPIAADEKDAERTYLSFKATLEALLEYEGLDLNGLSVTMPFKEHLVRWTRDTGRAVMPVDADEMVFEIGAANTVAMDGGVRVIKNTDAAAIRGLLDEALDGLSGRRVAIVGAGGVARAAAWACAAAGARVTIHNRTRERAERLVQELGAARREMRAEFVAGLTVGAWEELRSAQPEAVVQCTSVGMSGGPDEQGMSVPRECVDALAEDAVVLETVYRPVRTPLVRAAQERGVRVIDGVRMFVEQAALQFAAWTGTSAPRGLFERVCREALGEKESEP